MKTIMLRLTASWALLLFGIGIGVVQAAPSVSTNAAKNSNSVLSLDPASAAKPAVRQVKMVKIHGNYVIQVYASNTRHFAEKFVQRTANPSNFQLLK